MIELLNVDNLKIDFKTYNGVVTAVNGVSFSLKAGEVLGIVGESGCGKSVTASSLMGLLPTKITTITADKMQILDENLADLTERDWQRVRGNLVSMIFQDPMTSLNPILSIYTQLKETILQGEEMSEAKVRSTAIALLQSVGITSPEERLKQYPHEFSGGMRQRIVIAMALAAKPKLLIADEPTTALDVTTEAQILLLIKELLRKEGTGLIFISHNLRVVAQLCDRVVVMYGGTKVEEGTVEEIFYEPQHPYTKGLLNSIPYGKEHGELKAIKGQAPDLHNKISGCAFHLRCDEAMQICRRAKPPLTTISDTQCLTCWLPIKEEVLHDGK